MAFEKMAGARSIAAQGGGLEPQRQNNWVFEVFLPGSATAGNDILQLSLISGFLPSVSNEPVALPWLNEVVYVAGRTVYEGGTITLRDYVDGATALLIESWRKMVYDVETGKIGLAANYKQSANILTFAPDGSFERTWVLEGAWPATYNPGTLSMDSSDPVAIEVMIRYDRAKRVTNPAEFTGITG